MNKSILESLLLIAVLLSVAPAYATYPLEKANYWGYELETIPGLIDPQECATRCDKNTKCKVASVHGPGAPDGYANRCILRSAVGERHTEQADITSWVKPKFNVDDASRLGVIDPLKGALTIIRGGVRTALRTGESEHKTQATPSAPEQHEAENGSWGGAASVATDHTGYTGTGFVAFLTAVGSYSSFTVISPSAGNYTVTLRYSAGQNGPATDRTMHIYVNGVMIRQTSMTRTTDWNIWATKAETLLLNAGSNTIQYKFDSGDTGYINTDNIILKRGEGTVPVDSGLQGEYYDNRELRGPAKLTRIDPSINFDWGYGSPGESVPVDNFGVRWTGQIQPRFTESYVFTGYRDNGFRLWIDGQLLVDLWNNEWGAYESQSITLQANRRYDIKVDYYEDWGGTAVSLKWKSPSQAEEIVPAQYLSPATAGQTGSELLPPKNTTTGGTNESRSQLDRTQWFATRGSWNDNFGEGKPFDASGIAVDNGVLTLNADQTDQVGVLYSKPIAVPPGSTVVIRRRVLVHAANRKFEGSLMAFGVTDAALSASKPAINQCLFNVGYRNFDYETDQNLFALTDGKVYPRGPGKYAGGTAPTTAPLWDQWFEEEIRYNARTGETVYSINGQERMRLKARPLDQPYLKFLLHPYGWYTGHYIWMRDFQTAIEPSLAEPETKPDQSSCQQYSKIVSSFVQNLLNKKFPQALEAATDDFRNAVSENALAEFQAFVSGNGGGEYVAEDCQVARDGHVGMIGVLRFINGEKMHIVCVLKGNRVLYFRGGY